MLEITYARDHSGQVVYPLWWSGLTKDLKPEPKKCSALVWLERCKEPGSCEQTIKYETLSVSNVTQISKEAAGVSFSSGIYNLLVNDKYPE